MAGAPIGNTNHVIHGGRSKRSGLVAAKLGRRYARPYTNVCQFVRALREELTRRGKLDLVADARVQTAGRLEMTCRIAERQIATQTNLSDDALRGWRVLVGQQSAWRDRIVMELLQGTPATSGEGVDWSSIVAPGPAAEHETEGNAGGGG